MLILLALYSNRSFTDMVHLSQWQVFRADGITMGNLSLVDKNRLLGSSCFLESLKSV